MGNSICPAEFARKPQNYREVTPKMSRISHFVKQKGLQWVFGTFWDTLFVPNSLYAL
ncbi:MAG: hypothetical protein PUB11_03690 [Oscillospiraceae bacterium]|nr:hypothetical protein [Oscillospiraceae bacterium]